MLYVVTVWQKFHTFIEQCTILEILQRIRCTIILRYRLTETCPRVQKSVFDQAINRSS